jgi:hypothetical protein
VVVAGKAGNHHWKGKIPGGLAALQTTQRECPRKLYQIREFKDA